MENENCYKVHYVAIEADSKLACGDYEVVYAGSVDDAKVKCTEWLRLRMSWGSICSFKITFVADEEGNVL